MRADDPETGFGMIETPMERPGDPLAAAKKPTVEDAFRSIREVIDVLEHVVQDIETLSESQQRIWNSLMSAWVDIDLLKDGGKLKKNAARLEKELKIR